MSAFHTAYKVVFAEMVIEPPEAYEADVADEDVAHPRKLCPVRVGFVEEMGNEYEGVPFVATVALCEDGAPLPLLALYDSVSVWFLSQNAYNVVVPDAVTVIEPPDEYPAEVAEDDNAHPPNVYPLRVGFVEEIVNVYEGDVRVLLPVCWDGAPLPPFAL